MHSVLIDDCKNAYKSSEVSNKEKNEKKQQKKWDYESDMMQELNEEVKSQTSLFWNHKGIKSLPEQLFLYGFEIENLVMKNNLLKSIPDSIGNLVNLRTLYLSNNNLKSLPDSIGNLINLILCDLSANYLIEIPQSIKKWKVVNSINLGHNCLKTLPKEIGNLSQLKILDVRHNELEYLPDELGNIHSLMKLNLSRNKLTYIPEVLSKLPLLTSLSISHNDLIMLPMCSFMQQNSLFFSDNSNLRYINLPTYLNIVNVQKSYSNIFINPGIKFSGNTTTLNKVFITTKKIPINVKIRLDLLPLPTSLKAISNCLIYSFIEVPPLYELCFRAIFNHSIPRSTLYLNSIKEIVPTFIYKILLSGPTKSCDSLDCSKKIVSYASISVINLEVVQNKTDDRRHLIPLVLFFCSDFCSRHFKISSETWTDNFPFDGAAAVARGLQERLLTERI